MALSGSATAHLDDTVLQVDAGDTLVVPSTASFAIGNNGDTAFEAVVCLPAGATATLLPDGPTIVPPWAE